MKETIEKLKKENLDLKARLSVLEKFLQIKIMFIFAIANET